MSSEQDFYSYIHNGMNKLTNSSFMCLNAMLLNVALQIKRRAMLKCVEVEGKLKYLKNSTSRPQRNLMLCNV